MKGGDFRRPFLMNAERRMQNEELRTRVRVLLHSSFCVLRSAFICCLIAATTHAAPPRAYHLQLEANPAAPPKHAQLVG
jgi:hypothetical protein